MPFCTAPKQKHVSYPPQIMQTRNNVIALKFLDHEKWGSVVCPRPRGRFCISRTLSDQSLDGLEVVGWCTGGRAPLPPPKKLDKANSSTAK